MVDLPSTPLNVVTSEAPRSAVSPGQVAAPFAELGQALDKVGAGLEKVAIPFAEQAGYQSVSRDQNGNLVMQKAPIFGEAGAAYHRAAIYTGLAEASGEARRDDIAASKQYQNDPAGYAAWAGKYRDTMVQKYSAVDPQIGQIIGKQIDSQTTFNYRFLANQHQRIVEQNFARSTKAQMDSNTDDLLSVIRSGGDENSPEAKRLLGNIVAITHERVNNPVLAYPQEQAAADLKSLDLQIGAAKVGHQVDQIMKDPNGGAIAAMDFVDKNVRGNPQYTPLQQQFYSQEAEKTIRATAQDDARRATINTKMQKAADDAFESSVIKDSASPQPFMTANDIKTAEGVSPESKMRMLAWQHRQGAGEPLSQISHATSVDLLRRINLPDGDPNKITDPAVIREAYAPVDLTKPSTLSRADEDWLEKKLSDARSASGEHLSAINKQFSAAIKPLLDKSTLTALDESGPLRTYQFERYVDQKIDQYKNTPGKSPFDLFDPTKPDYLGKPEVIRQFQTTQQQRQSDMAAKTGGGVPPMPVVPPPPGSIRGAADAASPGAIWGNPADPMFARDHLTTVQTQTGLTAQVNKVAAPAFSAFLRDLENSGYKIDTVQGYNNRDIAGTTMLSQHAFGNAIDINPDRNQVAFGVGKFDLPPNVGEMAAKYGISWGGDWKSKKDYMHFEYVGPAQAAKAPDLSRRPGESLPEFARRVNGGSL